MKRVMRWGRSAYETDEQFALEEQVAREFGLDWVAHPELSAPTDLSEVDALVVTSKVRVTADVVARMRGNLVITTTSGYDHIDVAAATEANVSICRCPEARRDAVVEQAISMLMHLLRRQPTLLAAAADGRWARKDLPTLQPRSLFDARIVVVGLGVIGTRVADLLTLLGANVAGVDPLSDPEGVHKFDLDALLASADGVTLHCSLSDTSRNVLSAERLKKLPAHAVVVNTARGDVLDVEAAIDMVRQGTLGGLAADVFPQEPYPRLAEVAAVEGVLLTPHSSGFSEGLAGRVVAGVSLALMAWMSDNALPHQVLPLGQQ